MKSQNLKKLGYRCYWNEEIEALLIEGSVIRLTLNQTKLLSILVRHLNRPISAIDLFFEIWEDLDIEFNSRNIRNLVSNLRRKAPSLTIINIYGGHYMLRQSRDLEEIDFSDYLLQILDQAKNGITISDPNQPDNPLIYVNQAFSSLFGYTPDEVIGKNCRFLQGDDRDQSALEEVRHAISTQSDTTVILRNYTKSGRLIYNEVTISPIFDKNSGKLRYFLGVQKDVTSIHTLMQQIRGIV